MLFTLYYFVCSFYCVFRLYRKWEAQYDMGGNFMELLMVLCIGWILGPIDFAIKSYNYLYCIKKDRNTIDLKDTFNGEEIY